MVITQIKLILHFAMAILLCCASGVVSFAQNPTTPKEEFLVGRVIADVPRLTNGAGVGPLWQDFIFGLESETEPHKIKPVLIAYAFHSFEGHLRNTFFDHSKLYELRAHRDSTCDERVETLSIVKNETVDGKPLRPSPGISIVDGAPKDVLKPEMVLPCYVLYRGNYRVK